MDAENTLQVFDWLWTSGQLSEKDIACLPALGIEAVINLALPTSSNALPGEAEFVALQGIAYVHIPVEWERPELHQLVQFFGTLKAFEGRKFWVHCAKTCGCLRFGNKIVEKEEGCGYSTIHIGCFARPRSQ